MCGENCPLTASQKHQLIYFTPKLTFVLSHDSMMVLVVERQIYSYMSLSKVSVPGLSMDVDVIFVIGFNEPAAVIYFVSKSFPCFFFVFFSSMFVVPHFVTSS